MNAVRCVGWGLTAVLSATLLLPLINLPVGWAPLALVIVLVLFSAVRPEQALLLFVGLQAIATTLFVAFREGSVGLRYAEALTLAFIVGWAARRCVRPTALQVDPLVRRAVAGLSAAAVASLVVDVAILIAQQPGETIPELFGRVIGREYLFSADPLVSACLFVEGLVLLLAAADACAGNLQRRVGTLRLLVVGACAGAVINLLRLVTAAMRTGDTGPALFKMLTMVRVNVNFDDVNAAGSYFAMLLFVAIGFLSTEPWFGIVGIVLTSVGLWISGSRVALAATLITAGVCTLVLRRRSGRIVLRGAVLAALAAIAITGWLWYPAGRNLDAAAATSFRMQMARAALQLTASHPIFGVGLGRFYPLSVQFASIRENAHNNFLQILAELGVPGLALFASVVTVAIRAGWSAGRSALRGAIAGTGAFLLTCLGGHPLLVGGAAYPFWVVLGIFASGAGDAMRRSRRVSIAMAAVVTFFAITLPFRVHSAIRNADLENATVGFARLWQTEQDGTRYRWADAQCAFFVPAGTRAVAIPLRLPSHGPPRVEVRIMIDRREANAVVLQQGEGWRIVRLLPARLSSSRFSRIDLDARVPDTEEPLSGPLTIISGTIMVGKPVLWP
jgi:hypothetical protein